MNYLSVAFVGFAVSVVLTYFFFPIKKYRWTVLLAASYLFYAIANLKGFFYILTTTATTYGAAIWMQRTEDEAKAVLKTKKSEWDRTEKKAFKASVHRKKKRVFVATLVLNFGILAFVKYFDFFGGSVNLLMRIMGVQARIPGLRILLPLGISFYTFQSMGYLSDVFLGTVEAERNPAKFALFVSYFPQIIQGPIGMYSDLAHQLYEPHDFEFTQMKYGMELMLWGYFKKMVIADRAAAVILEVSGNYSSFYGGALLYIVLLYALQLYADFSAGIDISRGLSQILGIHMVQNFRRPYFANSINDYWRRWHISLGEWMKKYVFYPLALSDSMKNLTRKIKDSSWGKTALGVHLAGAVPAAIASFVIFMLVGIWHGANWKYVGFGLWNGGVIALSVLCKPLFDRTNQLLHIREKSFPHRLFQMTRTFLIVLVGYAFDIAPSFKAAVHMILWQFTRFFPMESWTQIKDLALTPGDHGILLAGSVILFAVDLVQERHPETSLRVMLDKKAFIVRWLLILLCVLVIVIFGIYGPNYAPAEFVYMQF